MFGIGTKKIGMDLGTKNTLIYTKNKEIVLREPSVVVKNKEKGDFIEFGEKAHRMIGRTPYPLVSIQPIVRGVIADFETTTKMIEQFIKEASKQAGSSWNKITLLIGVPVGFTAVDKQALIEAAQQAGAHEVLTIEEPLAAAIGANLPVMEPKGCMVVDIGGGTTEVAVISLNGIVSSESIKVAGNTMDQAIVQYIRNVRNLIIGERTAETIKINIGYVLLRTEVERNAKMDINGRDLLTGLPKTIEVSSEEIEGVLKDSMTAIIESVKRTLEQTPPELAADIIECGIVLTGGGALLKNMDNAIASATEVPVTVADNPLDCVAIGTGKAMDNLNRTLLQ